MRRTRALAAPFSAIKFALCTSRKPRIMFEFSENSLLIRIEYRQKMASPSNRGFKACC